MKNLSLKSVGLEKGQLYETIISTLNDNGVENAAPIGVLCKNSDEIVLYLYQGSQTHENIIRTGSFVVNLTRDALLFTKSTLGDLSSNYFYHMEENPILKDNEAYIIAKVTRKKELIRQNDYGSSKMTVITAKPEKIIKNKECVHPLNRGILAVIESLIHFTRLKLADPESRKILYLKIKDMNRLVQKVGSEAEKKAVQDILDTINQNFSKLE